jgi:hypothetical protein
MFFQSVMMLLNGILLHEHVQWEKNFIVNFKFYFIQKFYEWIEMEKFSGIILMVK